MMTGGTPMAMETTMLELRPSVLHTLSGNPHPRGLQLLQEDPHHLVGDTAPAKRRRLAARPRNMSLFQKISIQCPVPQFLHLYHALPTSGIFWMIQSFSSNIIQSPRVCRVTLRSGFSMTLVPGRISSVSTKLRSYSRSLFALRILW